jgi:small-conductance mechanosensitive channel
MHVPHGVWLPAAGAAALLLALAAHLALGRWMARQRRGEEARHDPRNAVAGARPWLSLSLRAVATPLLTLIWIHAASAVLALLLRQAAPGLVVERSTIALRWGYGAAIVMALLWLLSRVGTLIETFLIWQAARTRTSWDDVMLPLAGRTVRRTLPLIAIILGVPALGVSPAFEEILGNASSLAIIGVIAFVLFQAVEAVSGLVLRQYRLDVRDNLQARAVHTQIMVLKKVAMAVVGLFTIASMLMVFDSVRQFGASILASAGVAGLIIGFAAQKSIATMLAGFQIALTQPIRVDDVVIVENEWGRIEDITLTYVVVRIWDLRRLILPISYFIERPFQNWTRSSADLLATVFLYLDYGAPIDALRDELTRILKGSPHWDGKVNVLQVTDAKERVLEVRALASAADASLAWDLRCEVREKLVTFLQEGHPGSLPRVRVEVDGTIPHGGLS